MATAVRVAMTATMRVRTETWDSRLVGGRSVVAPVVPVVIGVVVIVPVRVLVVLIVLVAVIAALAGRGGVVRRGVVIIVHRDGLRSDDTGGAVVAGTGVVVLDRL